MIKWIKKYFDKQRIEWNEYRKAHYEYCIERGYEIIEYPKGYPLHGKEFDDYRNRNWKDWFIKKEI